MMKPYGVRLIEFPDVADLHEMGSKSSVGGGRQHSRQVASKARTRRYWAHKARGAAKREIRLECNSDFT